jgi:hypothetical protein
MNVRIGRAARPGSTVTSADIDSGAKVTLSRNWLPSSEPRFCAPTWSLAWNPREDHASYIATWLRVLAADNRAVFTAAAHAQRAAEFINTRAAAAAQVTTTCAA